MTPRNLQVGIAVTIVLIVVGIFFVVGLPFSTSPLSPAPEAPQGQVITQDIAAGTGAMAQPGDTIVVNYTGKFEDGTVFDTSAGKAPYTFVLGAGSVIQGWDQGLVGAQAGTRRLLIVPPALGYGAADYGPIPGNSTLIFEVEVLNVEPGQ